MKVRGFEVISVENRNNKVEEIVLPLRGTKTSAGYDFHATERLVIRPQEKVFFWTDVKAYMNDDEVLLLDVRSSMGIKHDLMLSNTLPVIDNDYYNNKGNEGNIGISIRNLKPTMELVGNTIYGVQGAFGKPQEIVVPNVVDLTEENTVIIEKGDRVAQGIFLQYKESDNCNTIEERESGIGSTGK